MKTRKGFVSNSSSSSFVIQRHHLSDVVVDKIVNHITEAARQTSAEHGIHFGCLDDPWDIEVFDDKIVGYTYMDNFDMETFLTYLGVPEEHIEWWHS